MHQRSLDKPCHLCKNVLGRTEVPAEHQYLVRYTCSNPALFDLHTPESFQAMVRNIKLAAGDHDRKRFEKLQQVYGLVYKTLGILWCEELQDICEPVSGTYWDWMHILMASGGVAQYEFNQYVRRLSAAGVSLQALDAFAAQVVWPALAPSWPKQYFQKRVVNEDDAHLKAFASELFQLMDILSLLLHLVVWPARILERETKCLVSMMAIINILASQEKALLCLEELEAEIAKHHTMFMDLYPECCKPKTHWLWHVPQQMRRWQCNLSCFSPERKHKSMKTMAAKVFCNVDKGVLYRAVAQDMSTFVDEASVLTPLFLERPTKITEQGLWLRAFFPEMQEAYASKILRFEGGRIKQKDLVWIPQEGKLAEVSMFLQVRLLSSSEFLLRAIMYEETSQNLYVGTTQTRLLYCSADMRPVAFCRRQGGIYPCARLARTVP